MTCSPKGLGLLALMLAGLCGDSSAGTWSVRFDETGGGGAIDRVPSGGFVVSGQSGAGMIVFRLDDAGATMWQHTLTAPAGSLFSGGFVRASADGGFCVAASAAPSGSAGSYDAWLAKLDSDGGVVWQMLAGGPSFDLADDVVSLEDGGCLLVAESTPLTGSQALWVMRVGANGSIDWSITVDTAGTDLGGRAVELPDGDLVVAAGSLRSVSRVDGLVVRLASDGTAVWQRVLAGPAAVVPYALTVTASGDVLVGGDTGNGGAGDGPRGAFLARLDGQGALLWSRGYPGSIRIRAIASKGNGEIALAGETFVNLDPADGFIFVADASGTPISGTTHGGTGGDGLTAIVESGDGGLVVAGFSPPTASTSTRLLAEKTDAAGYVGSACTLIAPRVVPSESRPIKSRSSSAVLTSFTPTVAPQLFSASTGSAGSQLVCLAP